MIDGYGQFFIIRAIEDYHVKFATVYPGLGDGPSPQRIQNRHGRDEHRSDRVAAVETHAGKYDRIDHAIVMRPNRSSRNVVSQKGTPAGWGRVPLVAATG